MLLYIITGTYYSVSFAGKIHSPFLAIIGLTTFVLVPIIFSKTIQSKFARTIIFEFENNLLSIALYNPVTNILVKSYNVYYSDISSCIISSTSIKTSTITIFIGDGKTCQFSFTNELSTNWQPNYSENNISFFIFKNIYYYNREIILQKPFFASAVGKFLLYALPILLMITVISSIFFNAKMVCFSIMPILALYAQILARRKRDTDSFENFQACKMNGNK